MFLGVNDGSDMGKPRRTLRLIVEFDDEDGRAEVGMAHVAVVGFADVGVSAWA